jgi:hypothetical protein
MKKLNSGKLGDFLTFVRLMFRSENTASALNKTPGPSSNVNTILVCRESI